MVEEMLRAQLISLLTRFRISSIAIRTQCEQISVNTFNEAKAYSLLILVLPSEKIQNKYTSVSLNIKNKTLILQTFYDGMISICVCVRGHFSCVQIFATLWTVAR